MATLKDTRDALINDIRALAKTAEAEGRDLTDAEVDTIEAKDAEITTLNQRIKRAEKGLELAHIAGGGSGTGATDRRGQKVQYLSTKGIAPTASKVTEVVRTKAFGVEVQPVDLFNGAPVRLDQGDVVGLSQVVSVKVVTSPVFEYARQTARNNNAAIVRPGAVKPTSDYSFTKVNGELVVIAHLSQPYGTFDSEDHPELVDAVHQELVEGLQPAVESLILNGDTGVGSTEQTGVLNTSGVQTVAFATDALTTLRKAVTALESLRLPASVFALNPADWEALELARTTSGDLELQDRPVDRAARRVWGVPVVVSTEIPVGQAIALADGSVQLVMKEGIRVEATNVNGTDFETNQVRTRVEWRAAPAVVRPLGVVLADLTAA
ncbi:phage major capsid protein [Kocuria kalidii]|uniref:phage major capsid protein n=1 Tax=Kocuria kalidii TaxID=3376283 RepID=UPI0037B07E1B